MYEIKCLLSTVWAAMFEKTHPKRNFRLVFNLVFLVRESRVTTRACKLMENLGKVLKW